VIEHSHKQENWYSLESLVDKDGTWFAHLLVRWDELQLTEWAEEGERIGYKYTAQRIIVALPSDVQNQNEAIIYIENAKGAILAEAQKQLAREAV
jgi:hypothetical protein